MLSSLVRPSRSAFGRWSAALRAPRNADDCPLLGPILGYDRLIVRSPNEAFIGFSRIKNALISTYCVVNRIYFASRVANSGTKYGQGAGYIGPNTWYPSLDLREPERNAHS